MKKDPMKLARKEFPKYGAEHLTGDEHGDIWRMPWGQRWVVRSRMRLQDVRDQVEVLRVRQDPLWEFIPHHAPQIERVSGTKHFMERFQLMCDQADLTPLEVNAAALNPAETRYCYRTGTFAYMRGRIAVIAAEHKGTMRVITILWTSPDLWAKNPRDDAGARDAA